MHTGTMVRGFTITKMFCSEISLLNFATSWTLIYVLRNSPCRCPALPVMLRRALWRSLSARVDRGGGTGWPCPLPVNWDILHEASDLWSRDPRWDCLLPARWLMLRDMLLAVVGEDPNMAGSVFSCNLASSVAGRRRGWDSWSRRDME